MAKYAISQEGADAMLQLSSDIMSASDGIKQSTTALKNQIMQYMEDLGVYGLDICAMTMQIDGIMEDKQESFNKLSELAKSKAEVIYSLIGLSGNTTGNGSGIAGSVGTAQTSHRALLTSKEERIDGIIGDIQNGCGETIIRERAEEIHASLRDYSGAFSPDIRSAYNNTNADAYYASQMNALDEYINKSPKWQGEIYRGINVDSTTAAAILQGQTIDMLGPSSWSSDEYTADRFSGGGKDTRMVFVLGDNRSGASITHLSTYNGAEGEVLVPSGVQYVKDRVEQKIIDGQSYTYVYVHEMR